MMTFAQLKAADYRRPTLALFYGTNCPPCNQLKPVLKQLALDLGIRLEMFNAAEEVDAVRELGLRAVPTVLAVHRGECKVLWTGNLHKERILEKLHQEWML